MVATGNYHYVVNCFFDVLHRGEYRVVYLTPEYASLDTGFLAQVQNSVGKKKFDKRHHFNVNESQIKDWMCDEVSFPASLNWGSI